ncbi:hypothetical protein BH11PLA2_BH11PLA2_31590 [soil metagenome]
MNTLCRRPRFTSIFTIVVSLLLSSPVRSQVTWTAASGTDFFWDTSANWSTNLLPLTTENVTFGFAIPNPGSLPANPSIITLGSTEVANSLTFLNGYTLNGTGSLNLTSGSIAVAGGYSTDINVQLIGSGGLTKTGYGTLLLGNATNNYTGTTTVSNGLLAANSFAAFGTSTTAIVVTGDTTRGSGGGQLAVSGGFAGLTFSRDLLLSGGGLFGDSTSFLSSGNNTVSGVVITSSAVQTRLGSGGGTTTYTGAFNIGAGQITTFFGAGNTVISGPISLPAGAFLEKSLSVAATNALSTLVISGTQTLVGELRVTSGFLRVGDNTGAILAPTGGTFEIRSSNPTSYNTAFLTPRANSTVFMDHAVGNNGTINQTFQFDTVLNTTSGITTTFTGRNGTNFAFPAAYVLPTGGNTAHTNNGNGTVAFTNITLTDTTARTLTFSGNGDFVLTGTPLTSGAVVANVFSKTGKGNFFFDTGTTSLWTGSPVFGGGTVTIRTILNMSNTTATWNIGTVTTAGAITNVGISGTGAGSTTGRTLDFNSTSGNAYVNANQVGTAVTAWIFTAATFTSETSTSARTWFLGANNFNSTTGVLVNVDNEIRAAFVQTGTGVIGLTKFGRSTWSYAPAANSTSQITGTISILGGTLKMKDATAGTSFNIFSDSSPIVFGLGTFEQTAGGTFQYTGASNITSSELIGALTPTRGHGIITTVPTGTGTATLTFASLGTRSAGATINFAQGTSSPIKFTAAVAGTNGIFGGFATFGGVDFAAPVAAAGTVVAVAPGTALDATTAGLTTTNYLATGSLTRTTSGLLANSLKLAPSAATQTFTNLGTITLTTGGLLINNAFATYKFNGGQVGTTGETIIHVANATAANYTSKWEPSSARRRAQARLPKPGPVYSCSRVTAPSPATSN